MSYLRVRNSVKRAPRDLTHAEAYRWVIADLVKRGWNPLGWGGFDCAVRNYLHEYNYKD